MKFNKSSVFLMFILLTASLVIRAATADNERAAVDPTAANLNSVNYFFNAPRSFEVCTVTTDGGNLNVRATTKNGSKVIAKLPNGTDVNVISRGDYISRISVSLKRKLIRGWVSNDYLGNCIE